LRGYFFKAQIAKTQIAL